MVPLSDNSPVQPAKFAIVLLVEGCKPSVYILLSKEEARKKAKAIAAGHRRFWKYRLPRKVQAYVCAVGE